MSVERISSFRPEVVCFPLVTAAYLAHLFVSGYDGFYYDAAVYWRLGDLFESNGHFSLLAYHTPTWSYPRGYSLPLLTHILHSLASWLDIGPVTIVKVSGALLAATLGVIVAPRLARALMPSASLGTARVLALNGLVFLFWRDHFDFPLSDFPALLIASVGVLGLLRGRTAGLLVAGFCFALASNLRSEYLPALLACLVVVAATHVRRRDWRGGAAATMLVIGGAFVALLPQMAINHHNLGRWSPFVEKGRELSMLQLSDGMVAQKRETYVGPASGYPDPRVFYLDPATTHVLAEEHISPTAHVLLSQYVSVTSYREYARILLHHPFEMAASYVRHLFNGLDVRYPTPYVRNLRDTSIVLSLLNYTLIFVALARLLVPRARRALGPVRWVGVVVLLSPVLTVLPGAVEPRFFLPVQLLVYMLVCFGTGLRDSLLSGSVRHRVGLAGAYLAFLLVSLTFSSTTLSHLEHPGPTLGLGAIHGR